jgi:S-adenosylmethionine:tRNA ribosyltransferase-isomerase
MRVDDFDYHLPPELIAQHPPVQRDGGRLLRLLRESGEVSHHLLTDLPELLPRRSLLVVNDTRVIPARLWAHRATGGRVEVLLVERVDSAEPPPRAGSEIWSCMVRSSKPLRLGETLRTDPRPGAADLPPPGIRVVSAPEGGRCRVEITDVAGLRVHGSVPLPPYIRRADGAEDRERYQTIYAREEGSIAAPTAGLHFTPALLERLGKQGVERCAITLHVGPGTFVPVRTDEVEAHRMEAERYAVPEATAAALAHARAEGRRVIAVGTTVVRTLEASGGTAGEGRTALFITPGHAFRVVQGLLTNFHLPRSTLLMLVSAFAGRDRVLEAYRQAVEERYRFYSFGDAMLVV